MAAAAQQHFDHLRSQAERIMRYQLPKGTVVTALVISVCLGVFFAVFGALVPGWSAACRAASWVLAGGVPLAAVAFFFLDAYQRRRLRWILAKMQLALDMDFAGELR